MSEGEEKKRVEDAVAALVDVGLVETHCIDDDGGFTYRLTEKGVELNEAIKRRDPAFDTEDEGDIAMQNLLNIIGEDAEGAEDE